MIIDNKGKLFGKISIVDFCIILVIVVGVLGASFAMSVINSGKLRENSKLALSSSSASTTATVTLRVKGVRAMTKDAICVGNEVYDTISDSLVGTISKVTSKPATGEYIANDGTFYKATIPEKYDVEIFVDVSGKMTETGFYTADEVHILYGKSIEIKTSSIKTTTEITGIEFDSTGEQE